MTAVSLASSSAGRSPAFNSDVTTSNRSHALDLIRQVRDPANGAIDTRRLAGWVLHARQQNPSFAEQAYADIEQALSELSPADVGRFNQDLLSALDAGTGLATGAAWGVGSAVAHMGDQRLINNPILVKRWEFTESAWTGKGGPSAPLEKLLREHGIERVSGLNPPPPGSLNRAQAQSQGINMQQANNHNGEKAREIIKNRYASEPLRYKNVDVEDSRSNGQRRVDVTALEVAKNTRYNRQIDTESKVGYTTQNETARRQVALDAQELAENRAVRAGGEFLSKAGRIVRPLGVVLDSMDVAKAYREDGHRVGQNTGRAVSGLAGGAAGAAAGAALGSIVPGLGTVVGGIIGGIVGGVAGDFAGQSLFDGARHLFE